MIDTFGFALILFGICSFIFLIITIVKFLWLKLKFQTFIATAYSTKTKKSINYHRKIIIQTYSNNNNKLRKMYLFSKILVGLFSVFFLITAVLFFIRISITWILLIESFLFLFLAIYFVLLIKISQIVSFTKVPSEIFEKNDDNKHLSDSLLLLNTSARKNFFYCVISLITFAIFLMAFSIFSLYI